MSNILILDAAFPPSPQQWVQDMDAVGAQGGAIYVYGGFTNYTKAHVDVAKAAGKQVLPIIVPGDAPPAPPLYAAAAPYGITSGPLVYDIESGSQPGPAWVQQGVQESNAAGWNAGVYSTGDLRASYSAGWWWEARWPYQAGTWQPVPVLPAGQIGWQYAHDVPINGSTYDISIFDASIFGGTAPPVAQPTPTNPADHWWGPYVSGATEVVELPVKCHAPVFQASGEWFQDTTPIGTPAVGQFCEWMLANKIGGVWYDMDESGGPTGQPAGRLPVAQSFWITDSSIDTTGCGGTDPVSVAAARGGTWYSIQSTTPPPVPTPTPPPADITAAVNAIHTAETALQSAQTALQEALKALGQ